MTNEFMEVTLMQVGEKIKNLESRLDKIESRSLVHNEEFVAMRKNVETLKTILSGNK
jgi:hypothetical protein